MRSVRWPRRFRPPLSNSPRPRSPGPCVTGRPPCIRPGERSSRPWARLAPSDPGRLNPRPASGSDRERTRVRRPGNPTDAAKAAIAIGHGRNASPHIHSILGPAGIARRGPIPEIHPMFNHPVLATPATILLALVLSGCAQPSPPAVVDRSGFRPWAPPATRANFAGHRYRAHKRRRSPRAPTRGAGRRGDGAWHHRSHRPRPSAGHSDA